MVASLQKGGNPQVSQILLKPVEGSREKLQEDALKSGNAFVPGQEQCLGLIYLKGLIVCIVWYGSVLPDWNLSGCLSCLFLMHWNLGE